MHKVEPIRKLEQDLKSYLSHFYSILVDSVGYQAVSLSHFNSENAVP